MAMKADKSVLFVGGRMGVGGVESVTKTMANEFAKDGWRVGIVAFEFTDKRFVEGLSKSVITHELSFPAFRLKNTLAFRRIMRELGTSLIVNQWALPLPLTMMLMFARPKGCKLINFFHTMPGGNKRVSESHGVQKLILSYLVGLNFKWTYRFSDAYVVLAECYEKMFCQIARLKRAPKLTHLPNPIAQKPMINVKKENVVLYVGRLELTEKRVDRVIDVWRRIAKELPDWRLEIVGDGNDRKYLEEYSRGLPRISFLGFQNPIEYYAHSKILLLTSDFEGFPLVLAEAMANRCVPIVLGSFPVAFEVVKESTGVVVPMPWDVDKFSDVVISVVKDGDKLAEMQVAAHDRASEYSIDLVKKHYEKLIDGLK